MCVLLLLLLLSYTRIYMYRLHFVLFVSDLHSLSAVGHTFGLRVGRRLTMWSCITISLESSLV